MLSKIHKVFNHFIILTLIILLQSCGGGFKLPGADARKVPPNFKDRVAKNLEEGKGFRINDTLQGKNKNRGGNFEFATSNELWRASLDVIDFMPLASANYSGGILITDWYSGGGEANESIKINIRFLSNEIRSDALNVDIFYKTCDKNLECIVEKKDSELNLEIVKKILQRATIYKTKQQEEDFTPYPKSPD
jgi:hypothetical protein